MTGKTAGFGWEDINLNNNGADVQIPVVNAMTLTGATVDVAFMPTSAPLQAGWTEILCQGYVSPTTAPLPAKGQAYLDVARSPDFGTPVIDNPNGSAVGTSAGVAQGMLFSIILKAWVGTTPDAAAPSRNVVQPLDLYVPAGSVIALHMDHMGVPGDAEMQVVLSY